MRIRTKAFDPPMFWSGNTRVLDKSLLQWAYPNGGPPYANVLTEMPAGSVSPANVSGYSWIQDEPHGFGNVNACQHVTERYLIGKYSLISKYGDTYIFEKDRSKAPLSAIALGHPTLTAPSMGLTLADWMDMQPEYESAVSLTNSIIELKDFKSLARRIVSGAKGLAHLARQVASQDRSKTVADMWLFNSFAVQPTISDVSKISETLPLFKESLRKFNERGSYGERRGIRRVERSTSKATFVDHVRVTETERTFAAGGRCFYEQASSGSLGDFLTYSGLTLTPAQVWNALPFSFLVDYVLNVGDSLERLCKSECTSIDWRGLTASELLVVKTTVYLPTTSAEMYSSSDLGSTTSDGLPVASTESRIYQRYATAPPHFEDVASLLPHWTSPTENQLSNCLALLRSCRP